MPTRPDQHIIEQKSKAFFHSALPSEWVRNELTSDYGKDFLVEVFAGGKPTGESLYVQLKGSRDLLRRDGYISFQLDCDHLEDYLINVGLPVFLIVVDVELSEAYWCFLQRHILEKFGTPEKWQGKRSLTIRIPLTDHLKSTDKLRSEIASATAFMVSHKVRLEQWRLEKLDPRFKVTIRADEHGTHVSVEPLQPVKVNIKFSSEVPAEVIDRFKRGYKVNVAPSTCKITGSPILSIQKEVSLQLSSNTRAEVLLVAQVEASKEAILEGFEGNLITGQTESRFHARHPIIPMEIGILQPLGGHAEVSISLAAKEWVGTPILRLKGFDLIKSFVDTLFSGAKTFVEWNRDGSWKEIDATALRDHLKDFGMLVKYLFQARRIFQRFGKNPKMPEVLLDEDLLNIDRLEAFLDGSIFEREVGKVKAIVEILKKANNKEILEKDKSIFAPMKMVFKNVPHKICGETIVIEELEQTITECRFAAIESSENPESTLLVFEGSMISREFYKLRHSN